MILDVGLPDMTGFEVCKQLRQFSAVPVMFLTARAEEIDRVVGPGDRRRRLCGQAIQPARGRGAGAGHPQAQQRRARSPRPASDEFHIDQERLQIHFCNRLLKLTALEFRLLQQLVGAPGRVHSREQLLAGVGMTPDVGYERNIDSHIKALRAKLREVAPEREPIQTHRGFGYSYQPTARDSRSEAAVAHAAAVSRRQRAGRCGGLVRACSQVQDEIKPAMRSSTEETLVDTANLLAELVATDLQAGTLSQGDLAQRARGLWRARSPSADIWGVRKDGVTHRVYVTDARGIVLLDSTGRDVGSDFSRWNDVVAHAARRVRRAHHRCGPGR